MHTATSPSFRQSESPEEAVEVSPRRLRSFLRALVPGLIAGAANDDPCAIGTYAKAGAVFGFSFLWTAPLTFPMMAATVYLCSKLSLVTGKGIAGVIRDYYPRWFSYSLVLSILIANIIEAGADIGAIAASLRLLVPIPVTGITIGITLIILALQTWSSYQRLQKIFAGLALMLFAYVGAAILANPDAREFLWATVTPKLHFSREYLAMLVALIGTRLSPYLYFWQSSQEVEEERLVGRTVATSSDELRTTAWHVNAGMFFSNLIMYFVILSTAATLFRNGHTNIVTAEQAAKALQPLAGHAVKIGFAARCAIQHDVADQHIFFRQKGGGRRWIDNQLPAGKSLAHVIVGVAFERQRHAPWNERTETLAGGTREADFDCAVWQPLRAITPRDLTAENRADGTVRITNRQL